RPIQRARTVAAGRACTRSGAPPIPAPPRCNPPLPAPARWRHPPMRCGRARPDRRARRWQARWRARRRFPGCATEAGSRGPRRPRAPGRRCWEASRARLLHRPPAPPLWRRDRRARSQEALSGIEDPVWIERLLQRPELANSLAQLAAEKHLARRPDPGVVRDGRSFVSDRREGSAPRSLSRVLRALEVRLGVFPRPKGDLVRRHPRETEERKLDRAAFLRRVGEMRAHQRKALSGPADGLVETFCALPGGGHVERLHESARG